MSRDIPIILLSGMASDERLFPAQIAAFPRLKAQPWIPPLPGESLRSYAQRLARIVDPGEPCLIGGASFGGIVGLEMSAHLPALGCILIGSVRSPAELPRSWRAMRPLAVFGADALRTLATAALKFGHRWLKPTTARQLRRLAHPDATFMRWAVCAVSNWRPSANARHVPVFQIHGSDDRVLPVALGKPDVIVPGGKHALSLFSPTEVNDFIAKVVQSVSTIPNVEPRNAH